MSIKIKSTNYLDLRMKCPGHLMLVTLLVLGTSVMSTSNE